MSAIAPTISDRSTDQLVQQPKNKVKILGQVTLTVLAVASAVASFVSTSALFPALTASLPFLTPITATLLSAVPVAGVMAIAAGGTFFTALLILGLVKLSKKPTENSAQTNQVVATPTQSEPEEQVPTPADATGL